MTRLRPGLSATPKRLSFILRLFAPLALVLSFVGCGGSTADDIATAIGAEGTDTGFYRLCTNRNATAEQRYTIAALFQSVGLDPEYTSCYQASTIINKLVTIQLAQTGIKDLSPLGALQNMAVLKANGNLIADLSPLKNVPDLIRLDVSYNKITTLSSADGLGNLGILDLSGNPIESLAGIERFAGLGNLNISATQVRDLSPIESLPRLYNFAASSMVYPESLRTLPAKRYKKLYLNDNGLSDLSSIAGKAGEVNELHVSYNQLTDLAGLSRLPKLKTLAASANRISRVGSNQLGQRSYVAIDLSANPIQDFGFLNRIDTIKGLNLSATGLTSMTPITRFLDEATFVDISANPISQFYFAGRTSLPRLEFLDVSLTQIGSFAPFLSVAAPKLDHFRAYDTPAMTKKPRCPEDGLPPAVAFFCERGYGL